MTQGALAFVLSFFLFGAAPQQQQQTQSIPDAPAPAGLSNIKGETTPGAGAGAEPAQSPNGAQPSTPVQATPPASQQPDNFQQTPPVMPKPGDQNAFRIVQQVNYIDVPVTVRDKHNQLVAGLGWRNFRIYEDGQRQRIAFWSVDPRPMAMAFVIDQTLPSDVMRKVNDSLRALTGALAPYDSVAVFTYNTSPDMITDFTGSQGPRLIAALQSAKKPGREMGMPTLSGPFASGPSINGHSVDPNLDVQRGNSGPFLSMPKDIHPLNDAILFAAKQLAKQPKDDHRRILYVITDGKEAGSKATQKEVLRYLLTNNISVYGTLVGDSSIWGLGYLDKVHLPLLPTNNVMPKYAVLTGGELNSQFSENGIQRSFSEIASSIRTQYTLGYYSHQPTISEKHHSIEVRVDIPGLNVQAKEGYYPSMSSVAP